MSKILNIPPPISNDLIPIANHYSASWLATPKAYIMATGPMYQMPPGFCILEFPPRADRDMWTYATCGMSCQPDAPPLELHLYSGESHDDHVELLTASAYYHLTGAYLGHGHTINFGRPWLPKSLCTHGLLSLPYLDGPNLAERKIRNRDVLFLWLIPITPAEIAYKKTHGLQGLEDLFARESLDFLDAERESLA